MWWHSGASWGFQVVFSELKLLIKINLDRKAGARGLFQCNIIFQAVNLISGETTQKIKEFIKKKKWNEIGTNFLDFQ